MGCGTGILGTLAVLLGVVIYAVVSSVIAKALIHSRFGSDAACAILTLTVTNLIVAFVLYEAIFIVWQVRSSQKASGKVDLSDGEKKTMDKIVLIVLIVCILLSLLFSLVNANTFTCLREDSISTVCFTTTKEYRWDERCDVLRYTFTCDENGAITYRITMKDGKSFDLLGGATSLSDSFREKYNADKVDLLCYVADLCEKLDNSEYIVERVVSSSTVENAQKVFEGDESKALIWEQIQRIIE